MIDFICPVQVNSENRLRLFEQTIDSLVANTNARNINRIILIDDCSQLKYDIKSGGNIFVHQNEKMLGVGGSKNLGADIAKSMGKGNLLYFFDSDVYFTKGWDQKMIEIYEQVKGEFKILAGGVHPFLQSRNGESCYLQGATVTSHDAVSGWSWLLDYEVWEKYGKLADNSIGTGKSEDWEYCQRVRNDGFKVGCISPQVIGHCGLTNTEGEHIVGYQESLDLVKSVAEGALIL